MKRRSFLVALGLVAAAPALGADAVIKALTPVPIPIPPPRPRRADRAIARRVEALDQLRGLEGRPSTQQIAHAALALLVAQLGSEYARHLELDPDHAHIGWTVRVPRPTRRFDARLPTTPIGPIDYDDPAIFTQQFHVAYNEHTDPGGFDRAGRYPDRFIIPAVAALAHGIYEHRLRVFGRLPLPPGVDAVECAEPSSCLSVRAIRQYIVDYVDGRPAMLVRLDVLGAVLPPLHVVPDDRRILDVAREQLGLQRPARARTLGHGKQPAARYP